MNLPRTWGRDDVRERRASCACCGFRRVPSIVCEPGTCNRAPGVRTHSLRGPRLCQPPGRVRFQTLLRIRPPGLRGSYDRVAMTLESAAAPPEAPAAPAPGEGAEQPRIELRIAAGILAALPA